MTKEVLISIQGLQFAGHDWKEASADKELERIETIYPGEYYFRNDAHYVLYEELLEGFGEKVKNMIKFRDKEFSIIKKGPVNVHMFFSEGKKSITEYNTPFGTILIALDTHDVCIEQKEDIFEIHIHYGLEANYQYMADCNISIKIKAVEGNDSALS